MQLAHHRNNTQQPMRRSIRRPCTCAAATSKTAWRTTQLQRRGHAGCVTLALASALALMVLGATVAGHDDRPCIRMRTATLELDAARFAPGPFPLQRRPSTADASLDSGSSAFSAPTPPPPSEQAPAAEPPTPAARLHSPLWGNVGGRRQYLMAFLGSSERATLHQLLGSMPAATIASYIPDNTWLVVADDSVAAAAAALEGVQVVEYLPEHKVAPEWSPILEPLQRSDNHAGRKARRRQRRLLQEWSSGTETGTGLDHLLLQEPPSLKPHAAISVSFPPALVLPPQLAPESAKRSKRRQRQVRQVHQPRLPEAAAQDWLGPLQQLLLSSGPGCLPLISPSVRGLQVAVCPEDLAKTVAWLSRQPLVHFVSPVTRATTSNLFANIISQAAGLPDDAQAQPQAPAYTPFWRMNLQGSGQVLGISDTGMFMDSCFFRDASANMTPSWDSSAQSMVVRPKNHRKIVQYIGYGNLLDDNGHGTHVCGTALGSPPSSPSANITEARARDLAHARGVAPAAKLAFFDIYNGNAQNALVPPPDLVNGFLQLQYDAGARIESDSWGFNGVFAYSDASSQIDYFTWHHPDFLPVIAVGNNAVNGSASQVASPGPYDEWGLRKGGTVLAPATAKNCIGVGAVGNYAQPSDAMAPLLLFTASNQTTDEEIQMLSATPTTSLDFGSHALLLGLEFRVVIASPYQACQGPLDNAGEMQGSVVIVGRGGCTFSEKAIVVAAAGATAMLVISNDTHRLQPGSNPTGLSIPLAAVPLDVGRSILSLLNVITPTTSSITTSTSLDMTPAAGLTLHVQYKPQPDSRANPAYQDVPDFSGYGPLPDGRVKPDLVAPGASLLSATAPTSGSAGAQDTCAVVRQQGTSMATPVVAGSAALAREYFQKGYYPSGAPRSQDRHPNPSGMLLKAVLVAGAAPVTGSSLLLASSDDPATAAQARLASSQLARRFVGFGRLDLTHSLPLQGNLYGPGWNLQVVDMVPIQEGEAHSYTLTATGGPIIATLVWFDYPADSNARVSIVNDLDLEVIITPLQTVSSTANVVPAPGTARAAASASQQSASAPAGSTQAQGDPLLLGQLKYVGNAGLGDSPDRINTVERVVIPSVPVSASIKVTVMAFRIHSTVLDASTPQRYALAVLGNHRGSIVSQYNPQRLQG